MRAESSGSENARSGCVEDGRPPAVALGRIKVWLSAFSAIMLSASPLESRGFRTPQACPSNPGLTDKLPTTSQADELAALVDAQNSVQKSTPTNFQNDKIDLDALCTGS
jgi:hypothetical protein